MKNLPFYSWDYVKNLPFYSWDYVKNIIFAVVIKDFRYGHIENELCAGLMVYYDKPLMDKYPAWDFYLIGPSTADVCYAVFTNQLEKEFALEIAHLWNDGTLHRIYHLLC